MGRVWMCLKRLAGPTGLEPAISCVTGRRDNQLHYGPAAEWHRRPTGPRAGNGKLGLGFPPAKLSQVCAPDHPGIFHLVSFTSTPATPFPNPQHHDTARNGPGSPV